MSSIGKKIYDSVAEHVTPLVLFDQNQPGVILHSASLTLINTGEKKLGITCNHVLEYFDKHNKRLPKLVMAIAVAEDSPFQLLPRNKIIDSSSHYDLVSFDLEYLLTELDQNLSFWDEPDWAPPLAECNEDVFFVGCPGSERAVEESGAVIFHTITLAHNVSGVSDRHFVLVDEDNTRKFFEFDDSVEKNHQPFDWGGISGCAVWSTRESKKTIVGFIYESSDGPGAIIYASHACHLAKDGKFSVPLIG